MSGRVVVVATAAAVAACGGSLELRGDAGEDRVAGDRTDDSLDVFTEADGLETVADSAEESDGLREPLLPPIEELPGCGNGVLEPGEECDDRNRVDGDGCDWLCRLGDGEPLPEPDPTLTDYAPAGDPVAVGDPATTMVLDRPAAELPLVWTASAFATAYHAATVERDSGPIRFRRFDTDGMRLGTEWEYDESAEPFDGHDLAWTGDAFGLFFIDRARGILYVRLDRNGSPVGDPAVVEPDPSARLPAATWTAGGFFVLTWTVQTEGVFFSTCGGAEDGSSSVRAKRVELDGSMGPVATVILGSGPPLNVAAGPGGVGILFGTLASVSDCFIRFVRLDDTLTVATSSGALADPLTGGHRLPVVSSGSSYAVAWVACFTCGYPDPDYRLCVAQFTADGDLRRAPICNPLGIDVLVYGEAAMAAGDGGFLTLVEGLLREAEPWPTLRFARLDGNGRMLASSPGIVEPHMDGFSPVQPFDVAWGGDGFGVLYGNSAGLMPTHLPLFFRFLRRSP